MKRYKVRLKQWRREERKRQRRGEMTLTPGLMKTIDTYWNKKGKKRPR